MIDINQLTIGQLKELQSLAGCATPSQGKRLPLPVGAKIFVRTVTHYYTGRVVAVSEEEVQLDDAAWIADTGRFADFVGGKLANEIEPYPDGKGPTLNRGAFIEWCPAADLPRSQK